MAQWFYINGNFFTLFQLFFPQSELSNTELPIVTTEWFFRYTVHSVVINTQLCETVAQKYYLNTALYNVIITYHTIRGNWYNNHQVAQATFFQFHFTKLQYVFSECINCYLVARVYTMWSTNVNNRTLLKSASGTGWSIQISQRHFPPFFRPSAADGSLPNSSKIARISKLVR